MKPLWFIVLIYLVVLNGWGFLAMGLDKRKAQQQVWRTPEKHFFFIALLGGGLGVWLGMRTFRHKTQHTIFVIGIPLIIFLQVLLIVGVWYYLL